jgi:MFS family permease
VPFLTSTKEEPRMAGREPRLAAAGTRWMGRRFSHGFWVFFAAAFFFDFGFGLYFFLFNLFLSNLHYKENILGLVTGALTLGNVAGAIPVSLLSKRFGLQKLMLVCFAAAPLICMLRTVFLWIPAQVGLAFLAGAALSTWPVCFSPTVARLTTEENRVSAFSIVFATGIGSGTLAGIVGGYLPELLKTAGGAGQLVFGMRLVLLMACGIVMLGILPLLKLRLGTVEPPERRRPKLFHPFLRRFLPPFFLWSIVTGSFTPFAAVYLQKQLRIPLTQVGIVFSASQLGQFGAVLLAPLLFRRFGKIIGIMCTQIAAGVAIFALGRAEGVSPAIVFYLGYTSLQFMSGPGIYSLLMDRLPDGERSSASAVQNIVGALSQASAAVVAGSMITQYGYRSVLEGDAGIAILAALLLFVLLGSLDRLQPVPAQAEVC